MTIGGIISFIVLISIVFFLPLITVQRVNVAIDQDRIIGVSGQSIKVPLAVSASIPSRPGTNVAVYNFSSPDHLGVYILHIQITVIPFMGRLKPPLITPTIELWSIYGNNIGIGNSTVDVQNLPTGRLWPLEIRVTMYKDSTYIDEFTTRVCF